MVQGILFQGELLQPENIISIKMNSVILPEIFIMLFSGFLPDFLSDSCIIWINSCFLIFADLPPQKESIIVLKK